MWALPWFKNSDAGALRYLLGDWQVSGILTLQSGQVLDVTANAASLNAPGNTQRPNLNGKVTYVGEFGPGKYFFDPSAFPAPAANTWGSVTRNTGDVRGPRFTNLDVSITKQFGLGGRRMGEFRADFWNLPNTVHMSNPNSTFGNVLFGQVTSAYGERPLRFSARFMF